MNEITEGWIENYQLVNKKDVSPSHAIHVIKTEDVLRIIEELIFRSGWEMLPAECIDHKEFYLKGAKDMEEVWHDILKELKDKIRKLKDETDK